MPVLWTDQNRCRLLLTILEVSGHKSPPWEEVAEKMGAGYTGTGVRQQFQKLRKEVFPRASAAPGTNGTASVPNTPKRKRTRAQPLGKGQPLPRADRDDSEGSSESKRARLKEEDSFDPERTIVKTERVDEEGVVRLDDDDFYC